MDYRALVVGISGLFSVEGHYALGRETLYPLGEVRARCEDTGAVTARSMANLQLPSLKRMLTLESITQEGALAYGRTRR